MAGITSMSCPLGWRRRWLAANVLASRLRSGSPINEVFQHFQPRPGAFFRVELYCKSGITADGNVCIDMAIASGAVDAGTLFGRYVVTVHEIEVFVVVNTGPQRVGLLLLHQIPTHVRYLETLALGVDHGAGETLDHTGEEAQAIHPSAFIAMIEQHLLADTDTQQRLALVGQQFLYQPA